MNYPFRALFRHAPLRNLKNHPRLLMAIAVGMIMFALSYSLSQFRLVTDILLSWNAGALTYLGLGLGIMLTCQHERMHRRALLHDDGENIILIVASLASVLSLIAIVAELATTKTVTGWFKVAHIGLAALTLVTAWAFIHMGFAFHYAHAYYSKADFAKNPALIFPGDQQPGDMDFLYFAFVIGTSGQTAYISFASPDMRRTGLVHCVLSYGFNATVLALMINIAAGLIS